MLRTDRKYYFYNETRECTKCNKKSRKRCFGFIVGIPGFRFFNVLKHTHGGKEIDSHKCPHCNYQHKVPFGKTENTFPLVSRSKTYYEATKEEATGA